jgi:hypothetical protein
VYLDVLEVLEDEDEDHDQDHQADDERGPCSTEAGLPLARIRFLCLYVWRRRTLCHFAFIPQLPSGHQQLRSFGANGADSLVRFRTFGTSGTYSRELLHLGDIATGPVKAAVAGKGQSIAAWNSQKRIIRGRLMLLHTDRCTIRVILVRKQIIVPSETDKRIRRLARKKGISQSALIVEAVEALPDASSQVDHVLAFAGAIKGAPRKLSEHIDEVVYR